GATADALAADLVVLRVVDPTGELVARAVAPQDSALAAAVAASRASAEALIDGGVPEPTRRAAEHARAAGVHAVPARAGGGRVVGSVEVVRIRESFDADDQAIVDLAAAQLALVVRTLGATPGRGATGRRGRGWSWPASPWPREATAGARPSMRCASPSRAPAPGRAP